MKTLDNVKHPLGSEWSFWLFTNQKKNWADNLVNLATFDTVEDYWCLYHHMKVPSELNLGQEYMVFKEGIQPKWEDPANQAGGRWLIILDGEKAAHLDAIWLDTVLVLIGETFEHVDDVCGAQNRCLDEKLQSESGLRGGKETSRAHSYQDAILST